MPIRFVNAAEVEVEHLVVLVYGQPNVGKTTLGLTASKPLLLDFDAGIHRAHPVVRKSNSIVQIESWRDVADLQPSDLEQFDTVVVDTVGSCLDVMSMQIIAENSKMGSFGGGLSLQGYGVLKNRFRQWLEYLRRQHLDVVLLAHGIEEMKGEQMVDRIVAQGSSKQLIYQLSDLIGRYFVQNDKRILSFNPTETSYGKNFGLPPAYAVADPAEVPTTMASIITQALGLMNMNATHQKAERERLEALRSYLNSVEPSAQAYNDEAKSLADAAPVDKKMLVEIAALHGYTYDRENNSFVGNEPAPEPAPEPTAEPEILQHVAEAGEPQEAML